jgi:TFIIF-interacting CTD phosphatase-like protein
MMNKSLRSSQHVSLVATQNMSEAPTDVVVEDTIPLELDLTYKAYPTNILDQQDQVTQNKATLFYKVQWNDHSKDEATWEHEDFL